MMRTKELSSWAQLPNKQAADHCKIFSGLQQYYILNLIGEPDAVQPYLDAIIGAFARRNVIQYDAQRFFEGIRTAITENRCEAFKSTLRAADLLVVTDGEESRALTYPSVQLQIKESSLERKLLGKQTLLVTRKPIEEYGEAIKGLWFQCLSVSVNVKGDAE